MSDEIIIKIPDIGGASGVDVIELLVKPGDQIDLDTPLITLESDKASMEIPSTTKGIVKNLLLKIGDKVAEGDAILTLVHSKDDGLEEHTKDKQEIAPLASQKPTKSPAEQSKNTTPSKPKADVETTKIITIPDIGGAVDVDVIDIMVKEGDLINKDQALITLEGDKATMDIPSPTDGQVKSIQIKIGDKVSQGSPILVLITKEEASATNLNDKTEEVIAVPPEKKISSETAVPKPISTSGDQSSAIYYAGPAVRRLAREFGVDLGKVSGSGRKGRISKEDVQNYVKACLENKTSPVSFALPQAPTIDFSKFGSIEVKPLNKIKRLTGVNVHRSWITIPHVTQFDEADITQLEEFRKKETEAALAAGYKLTVLAFVTKVVSKALAQYPQFNASLDSSGENLIYKNYCNIGIAVETPNGLVVPVIKNVEKLSVGMIANEMANLSKKAREKGLQPADMSGGCFTISSLGGIGGTAFTPIVNSPEVAILGLSRSSFKPVYMNNSFEPRLMLPLSLSYDHRVIDGAEAARFTRFIAEMLSDIRRALI